ncbi:hypothetical protein E0Z10_g8995 [Xylaria hypoxylon]|uniref:Uncharacterized protein n=1 Tax=Xylaria hypoxylon TaxID=37992 RepID=A0A4Z0Y6U1_9PEZI|nr:hypothetical protein E0Z10_g8995 [Xylaria hypoxylon]
MPADQSITTTRPEPGTAKHYSEINNTGDNPDDQGKGRKERKKGEKRKDDDKKEEKEEKRKDDKRKEKKRDSFFFPK